MGRNGGATVKDIARQANVSSGTVSRVLNQHPNVAADLRDRVLVAAEALGYAPTVVPRTAGRTSGGRTIGFLLTLPYLAGSRSELMAPFWAGVLHGAEAAAAARGNKVVYRSLPGDGRSAGDALARIAELELDATLLVGDPSQEVVDAVEALGIPVALVDTQLEDGRRHDAVLPDYAEGSRRVVEELIAVGHRDIAFVGGPLVAGSRVRNAIPAVEARVRGLRDALAYADLPFRPELVQESDLTQEGAATAIHRLLDAGVEFTAVFCANDTAASGALVALRERGLRVPEDVSVVGCNDEFGSYTFPPLTTFSLDLAVLGATAVERVLARAADPRCPAVTTLLPVEVVRRASVAPPRHRA
jgi:LacI family transcriptional regulator